jgi:extracellular factor (EF) 3-hydroxypalmitic acid methyl ester biosynthesis protein
MNAFEFLTVDDRTLLLEQGDIATYAAEEVILEEGSQRNALHIILEGGARVERRHLGKRIVVATLAADDLFGEISFLEELGASASVVASSRTRVLSIGGRRLNSLLQSVPGLGARFYQSLAVLLARRLRLTTAMIPALMVEEVAQLKRFNAPRTGLPGSDAAPLPLQDALEAFKSAILTAERELATGKMTREQAQEVVDKGCDAMHAGLVHHLETGGAEAAGIGAFAFRETFPVLMTSRLIDRAFAKPRGFSGDFETIELIYDNDPAGDRRCGPLVDSWALRLAVCQAMRNGRAAMTALIRDRLSLWSGTTPMPVLNLGCGAGREAIDLFTADAAPAIAVSCVDIDAEALGAVAERARGAWVEDRFLLYQDNVLKLAAGAGKITPEPQALIYALGLADYMDDQQVVGLLDWIFDRLLPGGEAVIGNLDRSNPNRSFMEHVTAWTLAHRTAAELKSLFARSHFGRLPVTVEADATGIQLLARCRRT